MKKTPKLRFKGFEGEWEEKKLEEIANINPKCELPNTFEYVDLESVVGTIMRNHRTEHKESAPSRAQRLAQQGDIFYQMVRPYQRNNYFFNEDSTNYVFSSGYAQIRPSIDSGFLFTKLQSDSFLQQVLLNCVGTSFPAINPSSLSKLEVCYPTDKTEQQRIASYFTHLDTLIEASRQKVEKYKQVKAASLQALFPQHGERVPKLRFKGCEGEWKKVRADTIFKTTNERNRPDLPVLAATQDKGMVTRDSIGYNIFHDKSNESTYKHILPGQFVIHLRSFQGGFAHSAIEGICSPAYTILEFKDKTSHDDWFWSYVLTSKEFISSLELITYGIRDGRSISYEEFREMYFLVPSLQEQHLIAQYFTHLDSLLTLEQQRYEKLQQVKRASLSQMFA